jgi:hypothetical protein
VLPTKSHSEIAHVNISNIESFIIVFTAAQFIDYQVRNISMIIIVNLCARKAEYLKYQSSNSDSEIAHVNISNLESFVIFFTATQLIDYQV